MIAMYKSNSIARGNPSARTLWGFVRCIRFAGMVLVFAISIASSAVHAADTVTYYYTNTQGTVLAKSDAAGNLVTNSDYRPYGAQILGSPEDGPGYAGHVNDVDTGLIYMQARYYDSAIGRFLSVDPKTAQPGGRATFSRYAYASNNPIGNIDPDGRQTLPASVYQLDWQNPATRQVAGQYALGMVPGYGAYQCAMQGCGAGGWAMAALAMAPIAASLREFSAAGSVASEANSMRTLYRVVKPSELADIQSTGQFKILSGGVENSKYFATTSADASKYAKMAVNAFGDEAYTTVKTDAPLSVLQSAGRANVDTGIDAYLLNEQQLDGLKPIVLDNMDLPTGQ